MTAIDFHQHLWPDSFRRALERRTKPPYLRGHRLTLPRGGRFDVDPAAYAVERRLAEIDENGIYAAVVSLPPTCEPTPDLVEAWQEEAFQLQSATNDRLIPLAYSRAEPGFVGAVVSAPLLHRSGELLARLQRQNQFAFVHPAAAPPSRPAWRTAGVEYGHQVLDAYAWWIAAGAKRFPALRVVFALLGGGAAFQLERFVRRGLDPRAAYRANVWFETSSYGERALELTLQTFGADRLVFGSDAPIDRIDAARRTIRSFGEAVESALIDTNPQQLPGLSRERWAA